MAIPRLYVTNDLTAGSSFALRPEQAHYLSHVLRLRDGDCILLFNGRDGEWRATSALQARGRCSVTLLERVREQCQDTDLWLVFAPVKRTPIDTIASKATELGVSRLVPVLTQHTAVTRVNTQRLRANTIEAAEQCGRLTVPDVAEPVALQVLIASWPTGRRLLVCDETGTAPPIATALTEAADKAGAWAVLTGPEGGFAEPELDLLRKLTIVTPAGLGPRILRADTAAIAALACWQALLGDWRKGIPPSGHSGSS